MRRQATWIFFGGLGDRSESHCRDPSGVQFDSAGKPHVIVSTKTMPFRVQTGGQ